MSLTEGMSQAEIQELDSRFKKLKDIGIFQSYNLETGVVKVQSQLDLRNRLEYHVYRALKKAFPETRIRKNAVQLYLGGLLTNYKKEGLDQNAALIAMMVSLEKESDDGFTTLEPHLKETYKHWNFEKIKEH